VTFFVLASLKLARLMRKRNYAMVDINTLPDFLVFAGWYARWKGARLVLDMHEITPEFFMSKYGVREDHWLVRLSGFLERISMRYADHVLTINTPVQRLLEGRGLDSSKATILMNAADEAMFAGSSFVAPSEPLAKKFVMMYHGTLTNIYGLDIAIEAFGKAEKEMPGAEIWILGNGPEKSGLQDLARKLGVEEKVRFIGSVLPQEIPQWLSRCDAGVLPTRRDVFLDFSFSNKLSEYIISGKPVISSRLKTIQYYFGDDALAFFEPGDAADLARQMVRLYHDQEFRLRMAERAKKEYAPISWAVMKKRYLATIRDLIGPAESQDARPVQDNLAAVAAQ
jgi:glycosyltransferase involved in cell wall biosynthesis